MKTSPQFSKLLALSVALSIATAASADAATGWVIRTLQPETQMPAELEKWTNPPYNLQPVCINGYELSGTARFSALYVKPSDDIPVLTAVSLSESHMVQVDAIRQDAGYRLIWLNGFGVGSEARYSAIWKKTNGAAQRISLGRTLSEHQADNTSMEGNGYRLSGVSSYTVNGSPQHAGWWNYSPFASIQTDVVYSKTAAEYQTAFNAHPASQGWRLTSVSGYTVANTERFTAMFKKVPGSAPWWSMNGLDTANFDAANNNAHYTGYRPAFLHTYPFENAAKASAVWEHDHGLAPQWSGAISSAIAEYMETNQRPGLSFAITRRGRLIYASGFGFANTSTGEIVGPRHRFRTASVSKPITAVAVVRALEQFPGGLNSFVFGDGALLGNDYGTSTYSDFEKAIRVRNLLNMTSGWHNDGKLWYHDETSWGSDNGPAIDWQLDNSSVFEPGRYARYTNINYVTAARVVEKLSGQTYENYVKNEIFAPCGVTDIAVGNRRKADRQAREVVYYPDTEDSGPYLIDPRRMDGSTAWIAKPMDLLLFARRMDQDETHTDILSDANMTAMRTPSGAEPYQGNAGMNPDTYGLGWYSAGNPIQWWGHNGSMAGSTAYLVTREDGVSWAYMSNGQHGLDAGSGQLAQLVNGLIANIDAAGAWPGENYDLYAGVNNEYDAWRNQYFTALERSQPGLQESVWGFAADPDSDGLENGAEAYFGKNPLVPDRSPVTLIRSGDTLTIRWQRSVAERNVVPTVDVSLNMTTWLAGLGTTIQRRDDLITSVGYRWEEIVVNAGLGKRFYRLRFDPR